MQQLECESNSITCMSCLYVHVYGNKVIYDYYLSIYNLSLLCLYADNYDIWKSFKALFNFRIPLIGSNGN